MQLTRPRGLPPCVRGVTVAAALVLSLAGCGNAGRVDPPSTTGARAGSTATASPTRTASPEQAPSPTPTVWTGKFQGHTVKVPYGHGAPVSFTFDDGPSSKYTPQVLALLKKHQVPAVFCLIGNEARTHPGLVRREVNQGHELCNHSQDHDLAMNTKGKAYVDAEVDEGLADIRAAAPGVPVPFYRQPGGYWSPAVAQAMKRNDHYPLRWSDDPRDWSRPGSSKIVRRVVKDLRPGAVILMHDGGGDRSQTVEALSWLLEALPAAGWTPVLAPKKHLSAKAAAKPQ